MRSTSGSQQRTWSDLQQLARRVIRTANLAVMSHAELVSFDKTADSESQTGKKAG